MTSFSPKRLRAKLDALLKSKPSSPGSFMRLAAHMVDQECAYHAWDEVLSGLSSTGFVRNDFYEDTASTRGTERNYFDHSGDAVLFRARENVWRNSGGLSHDLVIGVVKDKMLKDEFAFKRKVYQDALNRFAAGAEQHAQMSEALKVLDQNERLFFPRGEGVLAVKGFAGLYVEPEIALGDLLASYSGISAMSSFLRKLPDQEPNRITLKDVIKYNFTYYDYLDDNLAELNPFGFRCLISLYRKKDLKDGVPVRGMRLQSEVPSGMDPLYSPDRSRVLREFPDLRDFGHFSHFRETFWPAVDSSGDSHSSGSDFGAVPDLGW